MEHPSKGRTGNKVRTYILYAFGEILLVVVGILIALQVNNWNEAKKIRSIELETLSEIQQALRQDIEVLNSNLAILEEKQRDARELIEHVEAKRPNSPELEAQMMRVYYHRGYKTFNTAAFELLKQRGFGIIQNDELRNKITSHYTTGLADISSILSRLESLNLLQGENIYKNFKIYSDGELGVVGAYDYAEVLSDPRVFGPFYHFELMINAYHDNLTSFKLKSEEVLLALSLELEERDKN